MKPMHIATPICCRRIAGGAVIMKWFSTRDPHRETIAATSSAPDPMVAEPQAPPATAPLTETAPVVTSAAPVPSGRAYNRYTRRRGEAFTGGAAESSA